LKWLTTTLNYHFFNAKSAKEANFKVFSRHSPNSR